MKKKETHQMKKVMVNHTKKHVPSDIQKKCCYWQNSSEGCRWGTSCMYLHRKHLTISSERLTEAENPQNICEPENVQLSCEECDYKTESKVSLKKHIEHSHCRKYSYDQCKCSFKVKSNLLNHINKHHKVDCYQCNNSPGTSFCIACKKGCCRKCKEINHKKETMEKVVKLGFVVKNFGPKEYICNDCLK